jgi:purine-binding chemotaxis protein CheW
MVIGERLNADLLDDEDDDDMEDSQEGKYLTFLLNNEEYGIEICFVTEIIGLQNITEVPDMPSFIKGVINLRGKVIPVMDVRLRFKMEFRVYDDRTCIIVINVKEQPVGLIVDRVSEVLDIPRGQIEPTPEIRKDRGNRFLQGMGKVGEEVKLLLDAEKLLFDWE